MTAADLVDDAQVVERVEQGAAHEELHGEVVHALGVHIPACRHMFTCQSQLHTLLPI